MLRFSGAKYLKLPSSEYHVIKKPIPNLPCNLKAGGGVKYWSTIKCLASQVFSLLGYLFVPYDIYVTTNGTCFSQIFR